MKHKVVTSIIVILVVLAFGQSDFNVNNSVKLDTGRLSPRLLNYQGFLTDTLGNPITNPSVSMTFGIWSLSGGGSQIWYETQNVSIAKGIFSVLLGTITTIPDSVFTKSTDRWLELTYAGITLSPRTRIVSAPYAYTSTLADTAANARLLQGKDTTALDARYVNEGQVNSIFMPMINDTVVTMPKIARAGAATNQVIKWNGATWAPGSDMSSADNHWNYLISDGADTTLQMGGRWGLARMGNILYGNADSTHVNFGVACTTGTNGQNYKYCTVSGGIRNIASQFGATVGGGYSNLASHMYATVGGGEDNISSGITATVSGGTSNAATIALATVGGGQGNVASDTAATVCGGRFNKARGKYSIVSGGGGAVEADSNAVSGDWSVIGGGSRNNVTGLYTTLGGGYYNIAVGGWSVVAGGRNNIAGDTGTAVCGGRYNKARGYYSVVSGGGSSYAADSNLASGNYAFIGGGRRNIASGPNTTVTGGYANVADTNDATVSGGFADTASGRASTVGGGYSNTAGGNYSIAGGGFRNTASGYYTTIGGGLSNTASSTYATVAGGYRDSSLASYSFTVGNNSTVLSGYDNSAAFNGQTSTASGQTRVGALSKVSGTFTIDHPLDPENKILNHYFVESPEMVLIYRGSAIIGADGKTQIHLPDYFDALNEEPIIYLTGIGTSNVYVVENVKENIFIIGGKTGAKVNWMVTGARKDPSAEITKIIMPVEQNKEGGLVGRSLDDEFLVTTMAQLERMGKADGFKFRHASEENRYEEMKRMIQESEKKKE